MFLIILSNDLTKILITKKDFISKIAIKNIRKKIDVLTYRFNVALASDDDEGTARVLGEAENII